MEAPPAWAQAAPPQQQQPLTAADHEQALFSKYSTLNEPVSETILRDVRAVGQKLKIVLQPLDSTQQLLRYEHYDAVTGTDADTRQTTTILSDNDKNILKQLKDWDLWGPLVLCLALAVILSFKAPTGQVSLTFAAVFCSVWVGGTVVTLNAQLLGGTISFFQSLCVLGYSIFPLVIAALVIGVIKIVFSWFWLDLILVAMGCVWALRTSSVFISIYIVPERKLLALYPVLFFYTFLAWLILLF